MACMQSVVVESSVIIKTAILKRKPDWAEDRQTKNLKRVHRPMSDKVKPSYHTKTFDGMVAGQASKMKLYTLIFTEQHFVGKEVTEQGPDGNITSRPFTFQEGMRELFSNKSFTEMFGNRKATLKVGPSNKETIKWLLDEGLIEPQWIGNQREFIDLVRGTVQDEFVQALSEVVPATVPAQSGEGILASKFAKEALAEDELTLQKQQNESELNQEAGEPESETGKAEPRQVKKGQKKTKAKSSAPDKLNDGLEDDNKNGSPDEV